MGELFFLFKRTEKSFRIKKRIGPTFPWSLERGSGSRCDDRKMQCSSRNQGACHMSVESESSYASTVAVKALSIVGCTYLYLSGWRENASSVYWVRKYHWEDQIQYWRSVFVPKSLILSLVKIKHKLFWKEKEKEMALISASHKTFL